MNDLLIFSELFSSDLYLISIVAFVAALVVGLLMKKSSFSLMSLVVVSILYAAGEALLKMNVSYGVSFAILIVGGIAFGGFWGFLLSFLITKSKEKYE